MLLLMEIKTAWARAHPVMLAWTHFLSHRAFLEFGELLLLNSNSLLYLVEPLIRRLTSIPFAKPWNMKPSPNFVASVSYSIPSLIAIILNVCCTAFALWNSGYSDQSQQIYKTRRCDEGSDKLFWGCNEKRVRRKRWNEHIMPLFLNSPKGCGISWLDFCDMRWRERASGLQGLALSLMNSFGVHPLGMQQDLVSSHGLYKPDASKLENLRYISNRGRAKERQRNAQATDKRFGEETSKDAKQRLEVNPSPKRPDFFPNATCP